MTDFKYGEIVKLTDDGIRHLVEMGYDYTFTNTDNEFTVIGTWSGLRNCVRIRHDGTSAIVLSEDVIRTGKMIDFGKHPFKDYYLNGVKPNDLPTHTYKGRVIEFIGKFGYDFLHPYDLEFFWPNVEPDDNNFIYCWPNAKAREKGKAGRTKTKPGKFFRMLLHERGADRNFETSNTYKRLCDSCMRYDRDYFGTPVHPVETYGTGDWVIFWAEDNAGCITARLLAYKGEDQLELGPIYATCQEGIDAIKDHIAGREHSGIAKGKWNGARIIKVEEDGRFCGPYLDQGLTFSDNGRYLVVDSCGDIEHDHEGWFGGEFCEHCDRYSGGVIYIEDVGHTACESCRENGFFISDYSGEWIENREHTEILVAKRRYESWAENEAENDAVFSEEVGEWLHSDIAQRTFEDEYIPEWYISEGKWFICTVEKVAYPAEEMVDTSVGPVAKCNYNEEEDVA